MKRSTTYVNTINDWEDISYDFDDIFFPFALDIRSPCFPIMFFGNP